MRKWWSVSLLLTACSAAPTARPVEHPRPQPEPAAQVRAAPAPREESVAVSGIEGSMSSYDVNTTMERRGAALAACHEPRARVVPALSGAVEFAIAVDAEGRVNDVTVQSSDLGDRALERCVGDVIAETQFPRPNGGAARLTWTMILSPARESAVAEAWDRERIARVLSKRLPELHRACEVRGGGQFDVTAYVNRRGRVVSAGVTSRREASTEELDCIVEELRSWPMPKPTTSRFAKVSFALAQAERPTLARRRDP